MNTMTQNSNFNNAPNHSDNDEIDLGALLSHLFYKKWLIIIITSLFFVGGVVASMLITPQYQTNVLLQVEDSKGSLPGLEDMADLFASESSVSTEIEILRSRSVIAEVATELGLQNKASFNYFPVVGNFISRRSGNQQLAQPLMGMSSYAWGGEEIEVATFDAPVGSSYQLEYLGSDNYQLSYNGEVLLNGKVGMMAENEQFGLRLFIQKFKANEGLVATLAKLPMMSVVNDINQRLKISEKGKKSGILQLVYKHQDKAFAVTILNAIANKYLLQNVERNSLEAKKSIEFIEQQLPQLKENLAIAEAELNDFRSANQSVDMTLEAQAVLEQSVELEKSISDLELKKKELLARFTSNHPTIALTDRQITHLTEQKNTLESKVEALPEAQQKILQLMRDVEVNTQVYVEMLNGAQKLKIAEAGTVGNVRILDHALTPIAPVSPKKRLIVMIATLLGAMLSMGYVLLRHALAKGVKNPADIESQLGISVLASIPTSEEQNKIYSFIEKKKSAPGLLLETSPKDISIESLRSARTSIQFMLMESDTNVISISGPAPMVGKSFVSSNLAALFSEIGKKVLIIDGDLRRGYLSRYFNLPKSPGLSELILGETKAELALKATKFENLTLLPSGEYPNSPAELLASKRFKEIMMTLSHKFDLVIIDTPPVLAVADAETIAKHAGLQILVGKYGQQDIGEYKETVKKLQQSGHDIDGVILNQVVVEETKAGYSYGYYQYEYK